MKKILNSFFIILSILLLSGCGEEKPEVVAKNFIDSFSKGDNQKVLEYLNKKDKEKFLNDTAKGCENAFIETIEKGFSFSSNRDEIEISKTIHSELGCPLDVALKTHIQGYYASIEDFIDQALDALDIVCINRHNRVRRKINQDIT